MRVGVNTLFLIPAQVGGSERYLSEMLCTMAADFEDVELVLFTNVENDEMFRTLLGGYRQVSCRRLNVQARNRAARIVREQVELPLRAREAGIDVLWSPGYTAPVYAPCRQVVTIHDMQYKTFPEDMTAAYRMVTDLSVRLACRRCDVVIAVSQFSKDEIVRHTTTPPDKVCVVHEGVSKHFAERLPGTTLRNTIRNVLGAEMPYILCVADSYPHKNLAVLVEAFADLMEEIPHRLALLGTARLGEPSLNRALKGLRSPERVVRIRRVSKEDLVALYQAADLFVLPSLYEGFGLPVLEAIMAGLPVVAARRGAIPEVGGDCVCYFDGAGKRDLAEKMREMLGMDFDSRRRWVLKAQERARQFTWAAAAEKTMECFSRAMKV